MSRQLAESGCFVRELQPMCAKNVAGRAAGNYRLIACASPEFRVSVVEKSLCALFEARGLAAQMGNNFAGEMK